jgi:hypothetical protein
MCPQVKMKKIFCFLSSMVFASCYAQADKKTEKFEKLFDVISSEKVLATPFAGVMQQLHGVCAPSTATGDDLLKKGNVACEKSADVRRFTMADAGSDPVTMIQSSFFGANKCQYMISVLNKRYGKPESKNGACKMSWKVKTIRGGAARHASIEADQKSNVVYFDLNEDQGSP